MSFSPNAKLGANNVEGFLNENGVSKFYRIRGADFSRFADRQGITGLGCLSVASPLAHLSLLCSEIA
jgi:hypothetical protein